MGKYEPLTRYLIDKAERSIPLSFVEIERILGFALPASQANRAWWSNNPDNNVMTQAWLSAGYHTEKVDVQSKKLIFRRVSASKRDKVEAISARPFTQPLFGAMKGTFTLAPGVDLTEPADPEMADFVERKYGRKMS